MTSSAPASTSDALSPTESVILSAAGSIARAAAIGAGRCRRAAVAPRRRFARHHRAGTVAVEDWPSASRCRRMLAHESTTIRELAAWIDARGSPATTHHRTSIPSSRCSRTACCPTTCGRARGRSTRECRTKPSAARRPAPSCSPARPAFSARASPPICSRARRRDCYCLVRGSREGAADRLRGRLIANGVAADAIAQPRGRSSRPTSPGRTSGCGTDEWPRLAATIDQVLHAGASVNWVAPYASLRARQRAGHARAPAAGVRPAADSVSLRLQPVGLLRRGRAGRRSTRRSIRCRTCAAFTSATRRRRSSPRRWSARPAGAACRSPSIGRRSSPAHSRTGAFNPDDLLSLLVRGCVRMGTAPDLDWPLDCEPVDVVSAGILALSAGAGTTTHLRHPRPRHWRECLLWMRLSGYAVRLVPYRRGCAQLDRETAASARSSAPAAARVLPDPPCRRDGPDAARAVRGWPAAARLVATAPTRGLAGGVDRPPLDAALLERYFAAYRAAGYLPAPAVPFIERNAGRATRRLRRGVLRSGASLAAAHRRRPSRRAMPLRPAPSTASSAS